MSSPRNMAVIDQEEPENDHQAEESDSGREEKAQESDHDEKMPDLEPEEKECDYRVEEPDMEKRKRPRENPREGARDHVWKMRKMGTTGSETSSGSGAFSGFGQDVPKIDQSEESIEQFMIRATKEIGISGAVSAGGSTDNAAAYEVKSPGGSSDELS